jgi:hypothetical protein
MKQNVSFDTIGDSYVIKLTDEEQYLLEKDIEPEDKPIVVGLTRTGEVRLKEIIFPKSTYSEQDVRETADRIKTRFEQEGCKSCIALSEVNNTPKTFMIPTPSQMIGVLLDTFKDSTQ